MSLAPGTRLGPYEVVASIGSGGMGEVYRARDARLHRDVAIKTLPQGFADDPARRARFEREATVGQILSAIFSSIPDLIAHHPRASEITLSRAFGIDDGLSIDLHPGARKFFDSQSSAKR